MLSRVQEWLHRPVDILPLAIFRIVFGVLMLFSTLRFIGHGWIDEFYIQPIYHFTYLGFGWVHPLPALGMYIVFGLLVLLSVLIAIGLFYRVSIISFFLLFTYVELIDKTYYLNHYYFISMMSVLMIALPLNQKWAFDTRLFTHLRVDCVPAWMLYAPRLMLGIVYFYAGLAKLNPDWMLGALPLRIWLPANAGMPVIGQWFDYAWVAYLMSWAGAAYDLTIPFWLSWQQTRMFAYCAVIVFHLMTAMLFNIGVFPYVMIACTLVFFNGSDWRWFANKFRLEIPIPQNQIKLKFSPILLWLVSIFFLWQLLMPLRHWLYPGNHLWTNEGYRFAWHVMLVEKNGSVIYRIENPDNEQFWIVYPSEYLTPQQEQQMSFQPDMILQFAHFLADTYATRCDCNPAIYADTYVSLNLRPGQPIVDSQRNLTGVEQTVLSANWIIPLSSE